MKEKSLEIAIAAGGTAGHINPALALAEELRSRGHHVTFYGQSTRLEAQLVPAAGFDFVPIEVSGFNRSRPWTLVTALYKMAKAQSSLGAYFQEHGKPDVACGFGAYVEMPLLNWCFKHDIPCVIHEQNSVPGLANKSLAKKCTTVCVAFPAAASIFKDISSQRTNIVVTGNPVRKSVLDATRDEGRRLLGIDEDSKVLLVFGGSLGAHHINSCMVAAADKLLEDENLVIVHSTGKKDYEQTLAELTLDEDKKTRYRLMSYISSMGDVLAASDLVLSRSGASSVAEIAALSRPSILVPYPYATANHQETNAHWLADVGAAKIILDDEMTAEGLYEMIVEMMDDKVLKAMSKSCEALGQDRAALALADQVEKSVLPHN